MKLASPLEVATLAPVVNLRRLARWRRRHARTDEAARKQSIRDLRGVFRMERVSGLLPSFGLSTWFDEPGHGWIMVGGLRLAPFRVVLAHRPGRDLELRYRFIPVREELVLDRGTWTGRALLFGREICRFRLVGAARARFDPVS